MRENKQIYADLEKLSTEYERAKLSSLSPAEKEQLSQYPLIMTPFNVDLRLVLPNNACFAKLREMC